MAVNTYRNSPTISPVEKTTGEGWDSSAQELLRGFVRGSLIDSAKDLPCILFEAKPSLEIISVSDNATDLFGADRISVVRQPRFLQERVAAEDRQLFQEKLADFESSGSVAFVHRFVQSSGLPVWVSLSLRQVDRNGEPIVYGCLVPMPNASRLCALEQEVVSRFIHKLGNQFQLLNLVVAALESFLPKSRESEVLQETLDKAIDLTRVLSDCNQVPSWISEVQLLEVMRAAVDSRVSEFSTSGVKLKTNFAGIPDDATVLSSPYFLEVAFGHVLQNALEATGSGGTVEFGGCMEIKGAQAVASLYIKDSGPGMPDCEQDQVILPFFSTKKGRDGLGLTVASRFIEMHGGVLRIKSLERTGTEVAILLPLDRRRDVLCA